MGNRRRRSQRRGAADQPAAAAGLSCGCSQLVVIDFQAVCADCGSPVRDRVVIPSSGRVGDTREVGASCACGGEAAGSGVIVEILSQ
jgi:hypothetical protein